MKKSSKDGFGIVVLGAVACAACCAGPLLAILGGLSLAGLASTLLVGAVGLAAFVAAGVAYIVVRETHIGRRRTEHGMELTFPNRADVEIDVRRFAVEEKRCCAFWGFDVTSDADTVPRGGVAGRARGVRDRGAQPRRGLHPAPALTQPGFGQGPSHLAAVGLEDAGNA